MRLRRDKARTMARRGQRRARVVPWWRTRTAFATFLIAAIAMTAGGMWWAWQAKLPQRAAGALAEQAFRVSAEMGLAVREVFVVGRRETGREDILAALDVRRGTPILSVDIHAARERLLHLPWVREVSIERVLPDTIVVHVAERRPLAVWQHQGRFALIDEGGDVILRRGLDRFRDLIVVVGEDAPAHAAQLVRTLETQPDLSRHVRAAVRIGGRRWNLRLAGGVDVHLPEQDQGAAWARLADYERDHGLLRSDVEVLDLRLPGRLIIRGPSLPEKRGQNKGRAT